MRKPIQMIGSITLLRGRGIFWATSKVSFRQNLDLKKGGFAAKRKRTTLEQIVAALKQLETGVPLRSSHIADDLIESGINVTKVADVHQNIDKLPNSYEGTVELSVDNAVIFI